MSAKNGQASKPDKPKPRRISLAGLKEKLWKRFARYVKDRDGNVCFTCDKGGLEKHGWHAGHLVTRQKASTLFDPANVHSQCAYCNKWLKGNVAEYTARFIVKYGLPKFEALMASSRKIRVWKPNELRELIEAIDKGGAEYEMLYAERYGL